MPMINVRPRLARIGILSSLALALVVAVAAAPDARAQPVDETFDDTVTVLEVEVPVRVLRGGVPVPGLTADDFEIRDRGVPQTITDFIVQDLREARLGEPDATSVRATSVRRSERRNLLMVFDLNQLGPLAFVRALPKIESWLSSPKGATDRIAVAVHGSVDGRTPRSKSLRLLTPFVNDPEQSRLALEVVARIYDRRAKRTEAALATLHAYQARPAARAELQSMVREVGMPVALQFLATPYGETSALGRLGDPKATRGLKEERPFKAVPDGRGLFGDAEFRVSSGTPESRFRWLTLAMAEAVTLLADLEGQNHVVLITEPGYPGVEDTYTTGRLEPMHNAFRRGGWTFHAVDTSGVGFRGDTLFYMANETGGELLENQLEIDQALDRLALRTELTYRLTFRPSDLGEPGSYHRLEVRLKSGDGPRTEIQHREGYYAPRPDGERVEQRDWFDLDAMLRDDRRFDESSVAVTAAPTETGVSVDVTIDRKTLLANRTTDAVALELTVAAIDADGAIVDRHDERIESPNAVVASSARFDLGTGTYRIRTLVREPLSGALALTTTPFARGGKGGKKGRNRN